MAKQKLTDLVIDALEDIKARDIFMYDVSKLTSVFDHIVTASAESTRQTKALARHVMDKAREAGFPVIGVEGEQTGEWVLVDLGDIVIHIMQPAIREYYKLEELWQGGKLEFPRPIVKKPAVKKVAKAKLVEKVEAKTATIAKAVAKAKPTEKAVTKTAAKVKAKTTAKKTTVKKTVTKAKSTTTTTKTKTGTVAKSRIAVATTKAKPAPKTTSAKTTSIKKPVAKPAANPTTRRRKTSTD